MRISENSFNILGVSMYDSKNIIIDKFNNELELEPEEKDFYDEHRYNLLLSSGRLKQEIRWFHSDDLKVLKISEMILDCLKIKHFK